MEFKGRPLFNRDPDSGVPSYIRIKREIPVARMPVKKERDVLTTIYDKIPGARSGGKNNRSTT